MKIGHDEVIDDSGQPRHRLQFLAVNAREDLILQTLDAAFIEGATLSIEFPTGEKYSLTPPASAVERN